MFFLFLSFSLTHSPKVLSNFVVLFPPVSQIQLFPLKAACSQAKRFWVSVRCQSMMLIFHIFLNFYGPHFQRQNVDLIFVYGYSFLAPGARELFWKVLNSSLSLSGILLLLYLTPEGKISRNWPSIFMTTEFYISNKRGFFPCRSFLLFLWLSQSFYPLSRNACAAVAHKGIWLILWIHRVALNSSSYSLGFFPPLCPIILLLVSFKHKHVLSPWATHNMQLNWIIYCFQLVTHVPI